MKCRVTHKVCYDSEHQAEQALLSARARFPVSSGTGPVAVYRCNYCECYHLTSKGEESYLLRSEDTKRKIDLEREAFYWESKIKGGR